MKKTMITVIAWSLILSSVAMVTFFRSMDSGEYEPYIETMASDNKVVINQLLEHIGLAEEAINEFGASSSQQAVELWSKGIMNRNGVLQYSVMDKNLQNEFKKTLIREENPSWVTGVSSPWVTKYEIVETVNVSNKLNLYKVKFYLATSNGEEEPVYNTLTVVDDGYKWVISSIR